VVEEKKPVPVVPEKVFKSKVSAFPPEIIRGIDEAIAKGFKSDKIRGYIVRAYQGPLEIPNRKTIDAYLKNRSKTAFANADKATKIKRELDYTEEELRTMRQRLDVAGTDISDLKGVLKKMVTLMLTRIQLTSQLQDNLLDPRVEHNIVKMVGEVRVLTVQLMELEGQLGVHEAVARLIVEKFFSDLAPVARKAFEDVVGTAKTKEFIEKLSKGYKSIDMERIRNEAVIEVSNVEKEQSGVKKIGAHAS
jgi:hypothetical protein